MYHPPSKRKQLIQRVIIYTLMVVSVVLLVALLVLYMLGWQFDRANGKIEQGGLVQFNSQPTGATIMIDGHDLGSRTSSKATLNPGQHIISMQRTGYNDWQKSVDVIPGSVLWLNYARLIPKDLPVTNVGDYKAVGSSSASPSRKWMAFVEEPSSPVIHLADLSGDTIKTTDLTLPAGTFTAPANAADQSFTLSEWDDSSRYLIVKHVYDKNKLEWLVVDTQNVANTQNITTLLGVDATKLDFSNNNNHQLYAQVGTDVRRIDLSAGTISRPLISEVAEFTVGGNDMIAYTTLIDPTTKERSVGYYTNGAKKSRAIRSYSDDGKAPLHIVIDTYYGDTYVSIAYADQVEILRGDGSLPSSDSDAVSSLTTAANISMPDGVDYLTSHTSGRFVVAQKGATYTTYDIELGRTTTTDLQGTAAVIQKLQWLDNYTFWSDRDGQLRLYEFDGANQHLIMPVVTGEDVTLSANGKYLYGISKGSDGTFHLSRVQLILG